MSDHGFGLLPPENLNKRDTLVKKIAMPLSHAPSNAAFESVRLHQVSVFSKTTTILSEAKAPITLLVVSSDVVLYTHTMNRTNRVVFGILLAQRKQNKFWLSSCK